jgi:hypothetical protein
MLVRHGDEDIERAHPARGQRRIGDARILHVEGRVVTEHVGLLDVPQVPLVVARKVDRVVGQVFIAALDAEVKHDGRAGIVLSRELAIRPAPSQLVGYQAMHGPGEVRVDNQGVAAVNTVLRPHPHGTPAAEQDLLHVLAEADLRAELLGQVGHRLADRPAAADRMIDAVAVFEVGQDREEAGTPEW